jgi:hypothetical protein
MRLAPDDAVLVTRFLDRPLLAGEWPILASHDEWRPEEWPMPELLQLYIVNEPGEKTVIRYSEDYPHRIADVRQIPVDEAQRYPPDHGELPPSHMRYELRRLFGLPEEAEPTVTVEEGVLFVLSVPPGAVDEVCRELAALGLTNVDVGEEQDGMVDVEIFQAGKVADLRPSVVATEGELSALASRAGGEFDGLVWALPSC